MNKPTKEELSFWDALKDGDDSGKLAFADWFAEKGSPIMAHALKWCVKRGHWPRVTPKERYYVWERRSSRDRKPFPFKLPQAVFDGIAVSHTRLMHYSTLRIAIADLAFVLDSLMILCSVPGEPTCHRVT